MGEGRDSQGQWLIKWLEARMEGKSGTYRLKERVPIPKQRSYCGREVKIDNLFVQVEQPVNQQQFERLRTDFMKILEPEESELSAKKLQKNLEKLKQSVNNMMGQETFSKMKTETGLENASLSVDNLIDKRKNFEIARIQPQVKENSFAPPQTKYQVQFPHVLVTADDVPDFSKAKPDGMSMNLTMFMKRSDEINETMKTAVPINPDATEKKFSVAEAFRKMVFAAENRVIDVNIVRGALTDWKVSVNKPELVSVMVPKKAISENVSGKMDISFPTVEPKIRDLAEELGIAEMKEEEEKLNVMMEEFSRNSVNMPDFSEVWATLNKL